MPSSDRYDATELTVGTTVLLLAFAIAALIYHHQQSAGLSGYDLDVHLARSDGLSTGSDVRLSGVKIGEISGLTLNLGTYMATVHMNIRDDIGVPKDSLVQVTVDGLLGNPYLLIRPGKSKTMLPAGGVITRSCGSADITSLIGRLGLMNGQSFCDQ